jgi:hypothetical protein
VSVRSSGPWAKIKFAASLQEADGLAARRSQWSASANDVDVSRRAKERPETGWTTKDLWRAPPCLLPGPAVPLAVAAWL